MGGKSAIHDEICPPSYLACVHRVLPVLQPVSDLARNHRVKKALAPLPLDIQACQVVRDPVTLLQLLLTNQKAAYKINDQLSQSENDLQLNLLILM